MDFVLLLLGVLSGGCGIMLLVASVKLFMRF